MKSKSDTRKKKNKNDLSIHRHVFYLNEEEQKQFLSIYQMSGKNSESKFTASIVLGKPLKIIKIDKTAIEYYAKLTDFYIQFQRIGNNYNQVVKTLNTNFSEKRALALLFHLEKYTNELYEISQKIIKLTEKFTLYLENK